MGLVDQFNALNNFIDKLDVNIIRQNLGLPQNINELPGPYFLQVINQILGKQNLSLDQLEQLPNLVQQGLVASLPERDKALVQQALLMHQQNPNGVTSTQMGPSLA